MKVSKREFIYSWIGVVIGAIFVFLFSVFPSYFEKWVNTIKMEGAQTAAGVIIATAEKEGSVSLYKLDEKGQKIEVKLLLEKKQQPQAEVKK